MNITLKGNKLFSFDYLFIDNKLKDYIIFQLWLGKIPFKYIFFIIYNPPKYKRAHLQTNKKENI